MTAHNKMAAVLSLLPSAVGECPDGARDCERRKLRGWGGRRVAGVVAWWVWILRMVEWALGGRSPVGREDSWMWWWLQ